MEKLISHVLLKDQLFFESHRENAFGFFLKNQIVSTSCQKCELSQLQKRKLPVSFREHILPRAWGQWNIKMAKRPRSISVKNCFISVWASCSDNDLPKRSLAICYHSHRKITSKQKRSRPLWCTAVQKQHCSWPPIGWGLTCRFSEVVVERGMWANIIQGTLWSTCIISTQGE